MDVVTPKKINLRLDRWLAQPFFSPRISKLELSLATVTMEDSQVRQRSNGTNFHRSAGKHTIWLFNIAMENHHFQ
jgi:hypothetical protein